MTIGCPLSQKIEIKEVIYGSKTSKCFLERDFAKSVVEGKCAANAASCVIKATDAYFGKKPCQSYAWKILNVTYTCNDGKLHDFTVNITYKQ